MHRSVGANCASTRMRRGRAARDASGGRDSVGARGRPTFALHVNLDDIDRVEREGGERVVHRALLSSSHRALPALPPGGHRSPCSPGGAHRSCPLPLLAAVLPPPGTQRRGEASLENGAGLEENGAGLCQRHGIGRGRRVTFARRSVAKASRRGRAGRRSLAPSAADRRSASRAERAGCERAAHYGALDPRHAALVGGWRARVRMALYALVRHRLDRDDAQPTLGQHKGKEADLHRRGGTKHIVGPSGGQGSGAGSETVLLRALRCPKTC
eukprot:2680275-Prymnesium_polylepis.2